MFKSKRIDLFIASHKSLACTEDVVLAQANKIHDGREPAGINGFCLETAGQSSHQEPLFRYNILHLIHQLELDVYYPDLPD